HRGFLHFHEITNLDFVRQRLWQNRNRITHEAGLLVEKGRKEKEFTMPKRKSIAAFSNPAFANNHRLATVAERLANQRPFLETDILHFAAAKLRSRECRSRSTSTRIRSFRAMAFPVRRKISRPRKPRGCMALP